MKNFTLFLILILLCDVSIAQNPKWILTPKVVDFTNPGFPNINPLPNTNDYDGSPAVAASNMQLDAKGNILFFVVNSQIYNKDGITIGSLEKPSSTTVNYHMIGNSELLVVPDPGNCSKYYIIGSGVNNNINAQSNYDNHYPFYGILDMSSRDNTETIISIDTNIYGRLIHFSDGYTLSNLADITPNYELPQKNMGGISMAVTNLRSDNTRLLFVNNGWTIFVYKIDATGIHYISEHPYLYSQYNYTSSNQDIRTEMEIVEIPHDKYRIATVFRHENSSLSQNQVVLYCSDLNLSGNFLSNTELYFPYNTNSLDQYKTPYIKGLEFSPDGNILYITHDITSLYPNPIEYYNFSSASGGYLTTTGDSDFQDSQIELGTDGKLYFATYNRLATLRFPNTPNVNNWNNNAINFSGFTYYPNNGYT